MPADTIKPVVPCWCLLVTEALNRLNWAHYNVKTSSIIKNDKDFDRDQPCLVAVFTVRGMKCTRERCRQE